MLPRVATLVLLLFVSCRTTSSPAAPATPDLRARSHAFALAQGARNIAATMDFWSAEGVLHLENAEQMHGRFAIEKRYGAWFPTLVSFWIEPKDFAMSGDLAYELGTTRTIAVDLKQATGKYVMVWRREADGTWRVAALSLTNNPISSAP
jgi:ketosteroid isomerase-like protein